MAADYATLADLMVHWAKLSREDHEEAEQKLHEASIEVRGNFPDLDARILAGRLDADVPRLVVCRMVKRALNVAEDAPPSGFESVQFSTGPFQMGGKINNPDGNIYMSAADKRLLGNSRRQSKAWTIHPGG